MADEFSRLWENQYLRTLAERHAEQIDREIITAMQSANRVREADSNNPQTIAQRVSESMDSQSLREIIQNCIRAGIDPRPAIELHKTLYGGFLCECKRCKEKSEQ